MRNFAGNVSEKCDGHRMSRNNLKTMSRAIVWDAQSRPRGKIEGAITGAAVFLACTVAGALYSSILHFLNARCNIIFLFL